MATAADRTMEGRHMTQHGSFSWNELTTGDVERAKTFYGDLLGWRYRAMEMGGGATCTIIRDSDQDAGGMVAMADIGMPKSVPPHWMSYIAVDDVRTAHRPRSPAWAARSIERAVRHPERRPDERGRRSDRRRGLPHDVRRRAPADPAGNRGRRRARRPALRTGSARRAGPRPRCCWLPARARSAMGSTGRP